MKKIFTNNGKRVFTVDFENRTVVFKAPAENFSYDDFSDCYNQFVGELKERGIDPCGSDNLSKAFVIAKVCYPELNFDFTNASDMAINAFANKFKPNISIQELFEATGVTTEPEKRLILKNAFNAIYIATVSQKWSRNIDLLEKLCAVAENIYNHIRSVDLIKEGEDLLALLFVVQGEQAATKLLFDSMCETPCVVSRLILAASIVNKKYPPLSKNNLEDMIKEYSAIRAIESNREIHYNVSNYIRDTVVDDITFKCVLDTQTLSKAAGELCLLIMAIANQVVNGECVIVIGYRNDVPVVCLKVVDNTLDGARLKKGDPLDSNMRTIVRKWADINKIDIAS